MNMDRVNNFSLDDNFKQSQNCFHYFVLRRKGSAVFATS